MPNPPADPDHECVRKNALASQTLSDFCEFVLPGGDGRALCEYKDNSLHYWVNLTSDELPIVLCAFEQYVDAVGLRGRKADYLVVGRYRNNTYVIFIELRQNLLSDQQWEKKKDQVEKSMRLLCKTETQPGTKHHNDITDIFTDAAGNMNNHKVIGVVMPAQRTKKRVSQIRKNVRIGGKNAIILSVSPPRRYQPTISWNELLEAIGL